MCPLSDQNDFRIGHHIREKPCGALFLWTRGHTVGAGGLNQPEWSPCILDGVATTLIASLVP